MRLHRMSMLAAGGVGYVLGAKAGRGRYEQIRRAMHEAPHATEVAKEKVVAATEKVRHVTGHAGGSHKDPFAVDPMEPESYDAPLATDAAADLRGGDPTYGRTWEGKGTTY